MMNNKYSSNIQKEDHSLAYIIAVIASAGYNFSYDRHDFGTDITIKEVVLRSNETYRETGKRIDFQLKATQTWKLKDNYIKYQLRKKNYSDLCERSQEGGIPLVLGLLCLPKNANFYAENNSTSLRIKYAMYWYTPPLNSPVTDKSQLIKIPTSQLLTPEVLRSLMKKYDEKGGICDVVSH